MRFDPLFDSFYTLGSLWVGITGQRNCSVDPDAISGVRAALEVPRTPVAVTAFVNVAVIPMDTERVLSDQTVLIEGHRITALGPASQVKVPAGADRIDGRGKYLMPGLAHMHAHPGSGDIVGLTYDETLGYMASQVTDGVTTVRTYNGVKGYITHDQAQMLQRASALGPHVYMPGLRITEKHEVLGYRDWSLKLERPDSAAAWVAAVKAAGYGFIDVKSNAVAARQQFPVVDAVLTAARRLGIPIAAHDHEASLEKVLTVGGYSGSYDHLTAFRGALGLPPKSSNFSVSDTLTPRQADVLLAKLPELAAAVSRSGLWVTPTLYCIETVYGGAPPIDLMIMRRMVKALHDAGVGLLLAADDGWDIHDDMTALIRAGLTPYQVLVAGTRDAARYLGVLDSSGTVAEGKWADLVLLHDNPLTDIQHAREPAGVMLHGRWLDRAALDQRLLTSKTGRKPRQHTWLRIKLRDAGQLLPPPYTAIRGFQRPVPYTTDPYKERREKLIRHIQEFEALAASLATAQSSGLEGSRTAQQVRQQMAEALGAMRALLPPTLAELHIAFDPRAKFDAAARVWLREQARQGYPVTVPGVKPVP